MYSEQHVFIEQNFGWNHTNQQIRLSYASDGAITGLIVLTWSNGDNQLQCDQSPETLVNILNTWNDIPDWYAQTTPDSFIHLALAVNNFERNPSQEIYMATGININQFPVKIAISV